MMRSTRLWGIACVTVLVVAGCAKTPPGELTTPSASSRPPAISTAPSAPASESPSAASTLTLGGKGIGKYDFGASEDKVVAAVAKRLGDPDSVSVGETCKGVSGQWGENYFYGGLTVRFKAKDLKTDSPRTLASWEFAVDKKLPKGLQLQDDVPLDLSFAKLKAKYPGSKSEDLGFGDGTKTLTLPNGLAFVGAKAPDFVMGGELPACE